MRRYLLVPFALVFVLGCYESHQRLAYAPEADGGAAPTHDASPDPEEPDASTPTPDAGQPWYDPAPWVGTYEGPATIRRCDGQNEGVRLWTFVQLQEDLPYLAGTCRGALELTGPTTARIQGADCWGEARLEPGPSLVIAGSTRTDCGVATWTYRGNRH